MTHTFLSVLPARYDDDDDDDDDDDFNSMPTHPGLFYT